MVPRVSRIICTTIFLIAILAFSAGAAEFSADMTINSATGGEMTGKVFVKGNALRQQFDTPMGPQVTIIEPGAAFMYVLLPGQKMYMEVPNSQVTLDEGEDMEAKFSAQGTVTNKGSETIEGYKCEVYHIVYNDPNMGEATVWVSRDLNYPLKIHTKNPQDTATFIYTNVVEEQLDKGLFSLPKGYVKFSM